MAAPAELLALRHAVRVATDAKELAHARAALRAYVDRASLESNAVTALRNAVINGTADALILAGVPKEKIDEARAWVAAHKASKRDPARIAMILRDAEGDTSGAVYVPPTTEGV